MVRQSVRGLLLICTLAVILAQPITASAASYTTYDGGFNSNFVQLGKDIACNISPLDHYVFFRSGQYEYMLVLGNLVFSGGSFRASSCRVLRITTDNVYASGVTIVRERLSDFVLTPGTSLVYSDLEYFPELVDVGSKYMFCLLLLLQVFLGMFLLRPIFGFTLRRR